MQDLSYDPHDPVFHFNGLRFSVQIFTFENVYGLDPDLCGVAGDADDFALSCRGLTWAGGQEKAAGSVSIHVRARAGRAVFEITARGAKTVRSVKLLLRDMPDGTIVNLREGDEQAIGDGGLILRYPNGWRGLHTAQVVMGGADGALTSFRSLDTRVRAKTFVFVHHHGGLTVELIHEGLATEPDDTLVVPPWEVGPYGTRDEAIGAQMEHVERAYGLVPWEQRADVPAWAREIALVAAIHCQHWTGYTFNDYARALAAIEWLADRIEPRRVLAYLPGWEGRYYWHYGAYHPEPRLGGEEGFAALMARARELGVHVMPMFGLNYASKNLENFEQWGAPAAYATAGGNAGGGSVDWDGSRHHDHGTGTLLNPGAPTWRHRLVSQIRALMDRYRFDGVYLDISAAWWNDPRHDVYDGAVGLIRAIRAGRPEVLVAGEGWFDAIGAATPLVMSGHTEPVLHWHDAPYPAIFDTYNRSFAHLILGDPGRGSTGVHELGHNATTRSPLRKGIIPMVTIVEDTLEKAPDEVARIIGDAERYAAMYLTPPTREAPGTA
jgi:hypothetical protein